MEKIKKIFTYLIFLVAVIVICILAISFFYPSKEKFSSTLFLDNIYYKSSRSKCFDCERESKKLHPTSCYDCENQKPLTKNSKPGRVLIR